MQEKWSSVFTTSQAVEASVAEWFSHWSCKPVVPGLSQGFFSLSDKTKTKVLSPYVLSCRWDVKHQVNQPTNRAVKSQKKARRLEFGI